MYLAEVSVRQRHRRSLVGDAGVAGDGVGPEQEDLTARSRDGGIARSKPSTHTCI
jgi:hypothetical protein